MNRPATVSLPILLVPGLLCSARLYSSQIEALWPFGPVTVADHRRDASMAAIAERILSTAPPHFALAGLSMGGYIALEIVRQAPKRVAKLALLDTRADADAPQASEKRRAMIALAEGGRFDEVPDIHFPAFVHKNRRDDVALKRLVRQMAGDTGPDAYVRQQTAIMNRAEAKPMLASIRCPTLVLVGDADELTPPHLSKEIAGQIAGAKLVVVPDSGHLTTLEQPEAVNAALVEWLSN